MNILIADKLEQKGRAALEALGCDIAFRPELSGEALTEAVAEIDPDVVIVRSTKVDSAAIAAGTQLKLIIRAGAGTDTIDVAAASERGVFVANCPGKNAVAVAELAWALILGCDRRVPAQTADLRRGVWNKAEYGRALGLAGRTLGILGLGTIGREVAARAHAFGMPVIAWSRSLAPATAASLGIAHARTPLDVAAAADIVSVHVAATDDTHHLIDGDFLAAMKPGATLINTSRGKVVDEAALLRAMNDRGIHAGLDVYESEPKATSAEVSLAIAAHENFVGTHHVGASTRQAQVAIALEAARVVREFAASGRVENCVNRAWRSAATCVLTIRHKNRPGVLAGVFRALGEAGINVEEMENVLYDGAHAACARIQLASAPEEKTIAAISGASDHILGVGLRTMS